MFKIYEMEKIRSKLALCTCILFFSIFLVSCSKSTKEKIIAENASAKVTKLYTLYDDKVSKIAELHNIDIQVGTVIFLKVTGIEDHDDMYDVYEVKYITYRPLVERYDGTPSETELGRRFQDYIVHVKFIGKDKYSNLANSARVLENEWKNL
jgi:hypothetical protein